MVKRKKIIGLCASDWHYKLYSEFNENQRRTKAKSALVLFIAKKAKKLGVPILFNGDLVHDPEQIKNVILEQLLIDLKAINKMKVKVYGISGNHDQAFANTFENQSPNYFKSLSHVFDNLIYMDFNAIETKDFNIYGIPYIKHNRDFKKLVKSIKLLKNGKKHILQLHTDLHGAKDTNNREVKTAHGIPKNMVKFFSKFDLVICGHIHKPQILKPKILMAGSIDQQRRSDMGCQMGYWEIYSDMTYKFIPLKHPKYIEINAHKELPDDFNFYIRKPIEEEETSNTGKSKKNTSIIKSYIKESGIKDKGKIRILKKYTKGYL